MNDAQQFERFYRRVQGSFFEFIRSCKGELYGPQIPAAKALEELTLDPDKKPKQIGIKAGTGVGKTRLMAWFLVWRWIRAKGSKHLVTAPGERQIRNITFNEIRQVIRESEWLVPFCDISGMKVSMRDAPDWCIVGAAASDQNALRGYHHPEMVAAVEELTGVEDANIDTLLRTLSQANNCFVSIFNPDKITGKAYEMFYDKAHHWPWNLTISKLEMAQAAPHLVDPSKIEQIRLEYGEDSPQWLIGVLGEFPTEGMRNVIPLSLCQQAEARDPFQVMLNSSPSRVIGVDFARFGGDENCIAVRQGSAITHLEAMISDPNDAAARAREIAYDMGWGTDCIIVIDGIGIGQGMIQGFEDAGFFIETFHPRAASPVEGFANHLSAAWWNLRNHLLEGGAIPFDATLRGQLITREFDVEKGELIRVEPKDAYVKRMGKSPDRADAVVMAFSAALSLEELLRKPENLPTRGRAPQGSSRLFKLPESTTLFKPGDLPGRGLFSR